MIPPVVRVCHANTRWAAPLKTNSHATNTATAIPATGGTTMARNPATIINTLSAMDQPSDFFKITGAITGTVLMILPPDLHSEFRYFGSAENCFPWGFFGVRAIRLRVRYAELSLAIALIRGSHHEESFAVMNEAKPGTRALLKPGHSHFAATYKQVALTQSGLRSNLPTSFF